jgi:hypothetical protein
MSVLKSPFLVNLQQKVIQLFIYFHNFCPPIIILENTLNQCIEEMWLW